MPESEDREADLKQRLRKEKGKKRKRTVLLGGMIGILLLGGAGLGLSNRLGKETAATVSSQSSEQNRSEFSDSHTKKIMIQIREGDYYIDGNVFSLEGISGYLQAYKQIEITLADEGAKKEAFDAIEDLLKDAGFSYQIKEQ